LKQSGDRKKFLQQLAAGTALTALGLFGEGLGASGEGKEQRGKRKAESEEGLEAGDRRLPTHLSGEEYWDAIRGNFNLPKQIYLNTGTLGLISKTALADVQERMERLSVGYYAVEDDVRASVARLLNADVSEICLTHNTTEGINIVAQGLRLKRGDEVVLTDQEHVGNALPWLNRARIDGIKIRVLQPAPTAAETLNRLEVLITRRTRVIALPHITCTSGHVLPAREISALARNRGILSFFDGAHGPGMLFPDMQEIGCDFYAACGHKWLCGPAGTGMLYVRRESLERVEALMVGAYSDTGWEVSQARQALDGLVKTAHRFDYGTQNAALAVGLKAAVVFMEGIGFAQVRERVGELAGMLQVKLMERDYVEMLTPTEPGSRSGMIGFRLKGKGLKDIEGREVARLYRIRLVPESGLDSVRISTHIYNGPGDVEGFVGALDGFMRG
jgi:selenocysteine lyase/cysteine desulfurase